MISWHVRSTMPGSDVPTRAGARCTSRGCCTSTRNRFFPSFWAKTSILPVSTAAIAGFASGSIFTNHCIETMGSATVSQRWQWPDAVRVVFDLDEQPLRWLRSSSDRFARFSEFESRVRSAFGRDLAVFAHDGHKRKVVALADLVVVEVMRGRDFKTAAAEFAVDVRVGDHRDQATEQRKHGFFAMQVRVALVFGMDCHGRVAKKRLGTSRRDHELRRRAVRHF